MNNINKKVLNTLVILIGISIVFSLVTFGYYQIIKSDNENRQNRTITLSAEGKVNTIPDIASINLQIFNEGKSVDTITKENNLKMQKVIDFLKTEGVKEKDIKTNEYNLYPVYDQKCAVNNDLSVSSYRTCNNILSKYKLDQTITVIIRDFTKIDAIIGKVPTLGINNMSNLTFTIEDMEKAQNEAKITAINKINTRKQELEKATNVKIGKIITISENNYGAYPSYQMMGKGLDMASSITPAPIQPGSQNVSANVSITFELR